MGARHDAPELPCQARRHGSQLARPTPDGGCSSQPAMLLLNTPSARPSASVDTLPDTVFDPATCERRGSVRRRLTRAGLLPSRESSDLTTLPCVLPFTQFRQGRGRPRHAQPVSTPTRTHAASVRNAG